LAIIASFHYLPYSQCSFIIYSCLQTSFDYHSIVDYSALPSLRQIYADELTKFEIINLPTNELFNLDDFYIEVHRQSRTHSSLTKVQIQNSQSLVASSLSLFVVAVHALAVQVFKNLSHVLELPWERYLEEMHEFGVKGDDALRFEKGADNVIQTRSTLTLVFSESKPGPCLVRFGEAFEVFAQGFITGHHPPFSTRIVGMGDE
jgi:hypothetical protein